MDTKSTGATGAAGATGATRDTTGGTTRDKFIRTSNPTSLSKYTIHELGIEKRINMHTQMVLSIKIKKTLPSVIKHVKWMNPRVLGTYLGIG